MSIDLESDELTEHYHKIAEYDGDKVPPPFLTWTAGCKTDLDRIREQLRALQQPFDLEGAVAGDARVPARLPYLWLAVQPRPAVVVQVSVLPIPAV